MTDQPTPRDADSSKESARPRMSLQQIHTWVDQEILQAQRRGEFDDLPGSGKLLKSLERPGDPDWWLKGLIQREKVDLTTALPGPMALRRERETYPESLLHLGEEEAVRAALEDFNARVLADRRQPHVGATSPAVVGRVDVEDMLVRWQEMRERSGARAAADRASEEPTSDVVEPVTRRRRWWRRPRWGPPPR